MFVVSKLPRTYTLAVKENIIKKSTFSSWRHERQVCQSLQSQRGGWGPNYFHYEEAHKRSCSFSFVSFCRLLDTAALNNPRVFFPNRWRKFLRKNILLRSGLLLPAIFLGMINWRSSVSCVSSFSIICQKYSIIYGTKGTSKLFSILWSTILLKSWFVTEQMYINISKVSKFLDIDRFHRSTEKQRYAKRVRKEKDILKTKKIKLLKNYRRSLGPLLWVFESNKCDDSRAVATLLLQRKNFKDV